MDRRSVRRAPVAVGLVALALTACSSDEVRDADGTVVAAGQVSVFELRAGDCLNPAPDTTGELVDVPVVPCDQPHTQEVLGIATHPDDDYPGAQTLSGWADGACVTMLEQELDLTLDDGVYVSYLLPTFDGWNVDEDRDVVCVMLFPTEGEMTGSLVAGTADVSRTAPVAPRLTEPSEPAPTDTPSPAATEADLTGDDG